jgi:hypothetical protein
MKTEIGEYLVGAWLKLVVACDFVDYNVRPPAQGIEGLGELDVVGLDLKHSKAYLCEVTTHLNGVGYYDFPTTIRKVREKYIRQQKYAKNIYLRISKLNICFGLRLFHQNTLRQ